MHKNAPTSVQIFIYPLSVLLKKKRLYGPKIYIYTDELQA